MWWVPVGGGHCLGSPTCTLGIERVRVVLMGAVASEIHLKNGKNVNRPRKEGYWLSRQRPGHKRLHLPREAPTLMLCREGDTGCVVGEGGGVA